MEQLKDISICLICHDSIVIPVSIVAFKCVSSGMCTYTVCLTCARDYLELNKSYRDRSSEVRCLTCQERIRLDGLNSKAYTVNYHVMKYLDVIIGNVSCPRCLEYKGTQKQIEEHLKSSCSERTLPCSFCRNMIKFKDTDGHMKVCPDVAKCQWCSHPYFPYISTKDVVHPEQIKHICPLAVHKCAYCEREMSVDDYIDHMLNHISQLDTKFENVKIR